MSDLVSLRLRTAALEAVAHGLDSLRESVEGNGAWPLEWHRPTGPAESKTPPFLTGLGVLALDVCDHRQARSILSRSRDFLVSSMEYPGLWRWPPHPLDLDSTGVCALALGPHSHPWMFFGRSIPRILSCRDDRGRFPLWTGHLGPFGIPDDNDYDPVINANVIAYLGDRAETRPAQRWIESLITENRVSDATSTWYAPMDLYYIVSRAIRTGAPAFEGLRAILPARIVSASPDNALRVAQAVSALCVLSDTAHVAFLRRCAEKLIDMQQPDGGWPSCEFTRAPGGVRIHLSRPLTTANCIEALTRLTQQRNAHPGTER